MKERETDERERVRTLDLEVAKARDAEQAALRAGENLTEQIADLERALAAGDRDTTLAEQIKRNQELESNLLSAEEKVKEQGLKLSKAAKDISDQRTELERVKNLARSERAQNSMVSLKGSAATRGIAVDGSYGANGVVFATPARITARTPAVRGARANTSPGGTNSSPIGVANAGRGSVARPPPPPRTPQVGNPMMYRQTPSSAKPAPPKTPATYNR
jgi:hypothetical protein